LTGCTGPSQETSVPKTPDLPDDDDELDDDDAPSPWARLVAASRPKPAPRKLRRRPPLKGKMSPASIAEVAAKLLNK
jgi:hypothetical protein